MFWGVRYHRSGLKKNGTCPLFYLVCKEREMDSSTYGRQHGQDLEATCKHAADEALGFMGSLRTCEHVPAASDGKASLCQGNPYFILTDIRYIFVMACLKILSLSISSCMPSDQIFNNLKSYFHCILCIASGRNFIRARFSQLCHRASLVNVKSRPLSSLANHFLSLGQEK